jgi:modulator of FtsH protease
MLMAVGAAYDVGAWNGFAAAEVGAAAALTGLLFVAVSINLDRILAFPRLPARAAETLVVLLLVLVVATLTLLPQPLRALGIEVALLAAATGAVTATVQIRHGPDGPDDPWYWYATRVAATQAVTVGFVVGGCSAAAGWGGGLFWFVPATLSGFVGAVYNAWVLLVEIVRHNSSTTEVGGAVIDGGPPDGP